MSLVRQFFFEAGRLITNPYAMVDTHGFKSPTGLEGICTAGLGSWGVPFKGSVEAA